MKKIAIATFGGLAALTLVMLSVPPASAGEACARTKFETKLVKDACAKGGQSAAKAAMKKYVKAAKKVAESKVTCKSCHSKLGPDYKLKKDALDNFKKWGGK